MTPAVAYLETLPDETGLTCAAFLERAIAWFADHGVTVERVMTDNGTEYRSKVHAAAVTRLRIKHPRARPYRPRTNGKAERFIQTMLPTAPTNKKIALSQPEDHDLAFSTGSLSKPAEFLVAEGVVDDISHESLRVLLREEGVSLQAIKTFKVSNDPKFEAKKNRVLELYDLADGNQQRFGVTARGDLSR